MTKMRRWIHDAYWDLHQHNVDHMTRTYDQVVEYRTSSLYRWLTEPYPKGRGY